jgi:7-cyano-7-deazaguanine synthase
MYVCTGVTWEHCELAAVRRFLAAIRNHRLQPLLTFDLKLTDVYPNHWSLTGQDPPSAGTSDDAVYLPARNALLIIKPAVWCQLHGIRELALAALGSNPFPDASPAFFRNLEAVLNVGSAPRLTITRPLAELTKTQVMQLAGDCPLDLTFSCIAPRGGLHCGRCNKCAERRTAFRDAGLADPTQYDGVEGLEPRSQT